MPEETRQAWYRCTRNNWWLSHLPRPLWCLPCQTNHVLPRYIIQHQCLCLHVQWLRWTCHIPTSDQCPPQCRMRHRQRAPGNLQEKIGTHSIRLGYPCTWANALWTQLCSLANGQATPSFGISENKSWSSATTYPRECSPTRTTATYQTLTIGCQQTTLPYTTTQTTPRQWGMLVVTHHGLCNSQCSPNSANNNHIHPNLQIFSQADTAMPTLYITIDGKSILDCQSGFSRGDGPIISTIDSKPNPNSCSLFVLRPTDWWQTVSLWLQRSFVIWRQMWEETRGKYEGLPVGKNLARNKEQVSKGFLQFS